ncbi:MazG-like family protein [Nitratiruptor sp. SB155-2]|uniref:MazG-like family protein n=1 Tax=Nitratiruptor sp. (strain SB155-2) TaxID=387092 RepID=UPI0001586F2C|nr:MazG-like family protein [Nitratiruptor sp. SB155-2]BAF69563.1 phage-related DNA-binding protein [Nitratiruptor sp. SB155-2]BAN05321.1 MazG-like protein [Nitratiruptor phage NrS-1]
MNTEMTFKLIRGWADDRGLIENSTPQAQWMKLDEELGELSVAIQKDKKADTIDAFGDVVVVLTIMAAQLGLELEECVKAAYEEIKDRKGYMSKDGVFVKEENY